MKTRKTPVHQQKTCIHCNTIYTPKTANSKYCNVSCGNKHRYILTNSDKQIQRRNEKAKIPNPNKIQCLICNGYYTKPMAHVWQVHGISAREYKEHFELYVSKGIIPSGHRELLRNHALDNSDVIIKQNLIEKGVQSRFYIGHTVNYTRTEKHKEDLRKNNISKTKSHIKHNYDNNI